MCDSSDQYVSCYKPLEEYYNLVVLDWDATTQDYTGGVDCICTTSTCDSTPTDCVMFFISSNACGVMDIAVEDPTCEDCRVCSTSGGLVEVEADGCYTTDLGCFTTAILSDVPEPPPGEPVIDNPSDVTFDSAGGCVKAGLLAGLSAVAMALSLFL